MALDDGDPGTLFHLNLKVNTEFRGFPYKFHLKGADYAAVMPGAIAIANQMKGWMPTDTEIIYATVTRDNSDRDSKFVRGALGSGVFAQTGTPPPAEVFDNPRSALLTRFETDSGLSLSRKFSTLPDEVLTDGSLVADIPDITATPLAAPAAVAATDTFAQAFNKFLQAVAFYSVFVKAGHAPGGVYRWEKFSGVFVLRQSAKKGGRVFSS